MKYPTRALSVKQPWAWLLAHAASYPDPKTIENRCWPTSFRGPVLIHASKAWGWEEKADLRNCRYEFGVEIPDELERGGIVGVATLVDCVTDSPSRWFCGQFGFVLLDARPLPFIPCKGMLGFFRPESAVLDQVRQHLGV